MTSTAFYSMLRWSFASAHNASANLSGNSKHATKNADGRVDGNHSTVYTSADILVHPSVQLTRGGLILIGLLSGGDYHPAGLARCGTGIAHGLAKCGLGEVLLEATQSLTRDVLPDFLTTWREDLRSELRTNSRGHLGSKKPLLAKAVPDSFPDVDVLLSYTNPIISATDAGARRTHTPPRWECEPDLGKLAHLCELHFEWGLKDVIIKRFRTVIWPSIVLRALRRSTLEAADTVPETRDAPGDQLQGMFGTPSKLLARHFSSMGFGVPGTGDGDGDSDGGLRELIVKIHGSRTHAYTDSILEYRLEVAPAELVRLACAGIQGLRKPADTTYDVQHSESEDESGSDSNVDGDTGKRRKKRGAGPPPEPESHLRVWMPACMVRPALPDLVERFETDLKAKRAKKSKSKSKGKQRAPPATTKAKSSSPSKGKAVKPPARLPVDSDAEEFDLNVSYSSEDEEGGPSPPPRTRTQAALPTATPLDHPQCPDYIQQQPAFSSQGHARQQILDITMSDDDKVNEPPGASATKSLPLSSPSKVLQTLDFNLKQAVNLCGVPPPTASSPPARKRPSPPSALRPFPMAFEEEESSNDDDDDPDMVVTDLPVLADTRHFFPGRGQQQLICSSQTSPSRRHQIPLPAKDARKGSSLGEGWIARAQGGGAAASETSMISISSGGSDGGDDDLVAPRVVAATSGDVDHEVIDLT